MQNYPSTNEPTSEQLPMKWHNFLIYFGLWAGAVLNIFSAYQYFSGMIYGDRYTASAVYATFSGMRTIDLLMASAMVVLGIYTIYTRFQLAGLKVGAPRKLTILYIASLALNLLYAVLASAATGLSLADIVGSSFIGTIIGSVAGIAINQIYYGKRAELFIN